MLSIYSYIITLLFGLALFFNAVLFIPQAIKIVKAKNAQSISLITFTGFISMQFISVLYGLLQNDWILTIGFLMSMISCGLVIICALIYRNKRKD
ncbi:PQ-loop domain-containing transporter [Francisella uliginis]|uniref:PQ-loop repeat-containing protein n=1 Tax=Francisella uliginis TaxID=573570 RepID=A0A1L4BSL1_9GAMM|nr:PQ-loop domain-containing transporter [Francisella uliginis]API86832.1 hypothetical protein F7310_05455 [Francisella uliginis]